MPPPAARERRGREGWRPTRIDCLEIRDDPAKGRGVFTVASIAAGSLIEAAPVIVVPAAQSALIDQTILHDYYFRWDDARSAALALGITSLCNHAKRPRARVRRNHAQNTLDLIALSPIAAGDEITIDYNCRLWFTPATS